MADPAQVERIAKAVGLGGDLPGTWFDAYDEIAAALDAGIDENAVINAGRTGGTDGISVLTRNYNANQPSNLSPPAPGYKWETTNGISRQVPTGEPTSPTPTSPTPTGGTTQSQIVSDLVKYLGFSPTDLADYAPEDLLGLYVEGQKSGLIPKTAAVGGTTSAVSADDVARAAGQNILNNFNPATDLITLPDGTSLIRGTTTVIDTRQGGALAPVSGMPDLFYDPISKQFVDRAGTKLDANRLLEDIRSNKVNEEISRGHLGVAQGQLGVSQGQLAENIRSNQVGEAIQGQDVTNKAVSNIAQLGANPANWVEREYTIRGMQAPSPTGSNRFDTTGALAKLYGTSPTSTPANTAAVVGTGGINGLAAVKPATPTPVPAAPVAPPVSPALQPGATSAAWNPVTQTSTMAPVNPDGQYSEDWTPATLGSVTNPNTGEVTGANTQSAPGTEGQNFYWDPQGEGGIKQFAQGGGTTDDQFITGDPQQGQVTGNPELVNVTDPENNATASVTPLSDMQQMQQGIPPDGSPTGMPQEGGLAKLMAGILIEISNQWAPSGGLAKYARGTGEDSADYQGPEDTEDYSLPNAPSRTNPLNYNTKLSDIGKKVGGSFREGAKGWRDMVMGGNPVVGFLAEMMSHNWENRPQAQLDARNEAGRNRFQDKLPRYAYGTGYETPTGEVTTQSSGNAFGQNLTSNYGLTPQSDANLQALPSIRALYSGDLGAYNAPREQTVQGPFGTTLPGSGQLNVANYNEVAKDPTSLGMLQSLYRGASRDLTSEVARARRFAPVGQGLRSLSTVRT